MSDIICECNWKRGTTANPPLETYRGRPRHRIGGGGVAEERVKEGLPLLGRIRVDIDIVEGAAILSEGGRGQLRLELGRIVQNCK